MTTPTPDSVLLAFKRVPPMDPGVVTMLIDDLLALREAARHVAGWGPVSAPHSCKCGWMMPVCRSPGEMSSAWAEHAKECPIEKIRALLPEVAG